MTTDSVGQRARQNATGIVSTIVTGAWLAALFLGFDWWLALMLVGYVVVVPLTAMLFGDEDEWEEWVKEEAKPAGDTTDPSEDNTENSAVALQRLRERYANGELTEDQFERKLEQLLRTETLEDVEDQYGEGTDGDVTVEQERNRQ